MELWEYILEFQPELTFQTEGCDMFGRKESPVRNLCCIIVGADGDLGSSLARMFYQGGAKLVLFGYDQEALERVSEECEDAPTELVDVTNRDHVLAAFDRSVATHLNGRLDIAVTFAGIAGQSVAGGNADIAIPTLRVNAEGTQNFFDAALPHVESSRGTIVVTSSMAEFLDLPFMGAYGGSKAFVGKLARTARMELRGTGVKVVEICPNVIDTNMTTKGYTTSVGGIIRRLVKPVKREKATRIIYWGIVRRKRRVFIPRWMAIVPWVSPYVNLVIEFGVSPVIQLLRKKALMDDSKVQLTTKQK